MNELIRSLETSIAAGPWRTEMQPLLSTGHPVPMLLVFECSDGRRYALTVDHAVIQYPQGGFTEWTTKEWRSVR